MPGITTIAGRRALSAGTLLAIGGGLAIYQMTSLVLGPAGSRELHLTLTIPAVDADESSLSFPSSVNLALGVLAGPASRPSVSASFTAPHRTFGTPAARRPVAPLPAPVAKTPPAVPVTLVGSQPPTPQPVKHPLPPIVGQPGQQAGTSNPDGND